MKNIVDKNSKPKTSDLVAWVINELKVNPDDFEFDKSRDSLIHKPAQFEFWTHKGIERLIWPAKVTFNCIQRWRFRNAFNKWAIKAVVERAMQPPKPARKKAAKRRRS